ncbi:TPA: hypothetical protein ACHU58_000895 [Streptococcus suis]
MSKTIKNGMKVVLLFFALFLINILVFKVLALLGFDLSLTELSYLFPPLLATLVLVLQFNKKKNSEKTRKRYEKLYETIHFSRYGSDYDYRGNYIRLTDWSCSRTI